MPAPSRATDTKQNQKDSTRSAEATRQNGEAPPAFSAQHSLLSLHRSIGNRAFGQVLQAKLAIGSPGDVYEKEVDQIADRGMRASRHGTKPVESAPDSSNVINHRCDACGNEKQTIRRKALQSNSGGISSQIPAHVQQVISSDGQPLDRGTRSFFEPRFGVSFGDVRVHTDGHAAQSARTINAFAYTFGSHIVFGVGRYAPHSTVGQRLLAHELTHVAQQSMGNTVSVDADELQADIAERGGMLQFSHTGTPQRRLRLKGGRAVSMTIAQGPGGKSATFLVETETGASLAASGSAEGLPEGQYVAKLRNGALLVIQQADGTPMPKTSRFDIPWSTVNAAAITALTRVKGSIPLTVGVGMEDSGGGGKSTSADVDLDRQEFDALPEHVRNFLIDPNSKGNMPPDYAKLLRIAKLIAKLSPEELAEYKARTTKGTADPADFEKSVEAWISQLESRGKTESEAEDATNALLGLDACYEMFRSWQHAMLMSNPPAWIYEWEATPTADLPRDREGEMNRLYLLMRQSLQVYGYANLAAFVKAIDRFVVAFRESAYLLGVGLLDRFEHTLFEQEGRYDASTATELYGSLTPARETFKAAEDYAAAARAQYSGWDQINEYHAAGIEYQQKKAMASGQVASLSGTHPLLAAQDFPREEVATADQARISSIMNSYIASHRKKVKDTRERLDGDHELVFKLDILLNQAKAQRGITPHSIWDKIIQDHTAPTVDDVWKEMALLVLGLAAGLLSGGSALAAVAAFALSSYAAIKQYQDYALKSDAYGAQMLTEDPWLGWVVIAVIGAVADLGTVASIIKPIRPALSEFQTGKLTLAELEARLAGVEEKARKAIMARAEIEQQARMGWKSLLPKDAALMSVFGLEHLAGPLVYAVYINIRRGINTFLKWRLTREAVDLVGDFSKLSPADAAKLESLFKKALADAQKIANYGRQVGMSEAEVGAAIEAWAKKGSGSAEEVILEMSQARSASRKATTSDAVLDQATDPVKAEPAKTGDKVEGGGRVVAGRSVKPRQATPTKYVWNNPRMPKGNFIEAELDGGVLEITVKAHGPEDLRVGGSKMLDDVFDHFGADKIQQFNAKWVRNSSFRDNYDAYVQNLENGMKPQEAAWNTWTGRQLKGRGFTRVEVPPHGQGPDIVSPVFKK